MNEKAAHSRDEKTGDWVSEDQRARSVDSAIKWRTDIDN